MANEVVARCQDERVVKGISTGGLVSEESR
jgi:hypothetical protein